ncbi:MAG TPA: cation diffusion facilitator family transporter [Candidatus Saccharimonadales bacterium]|nr:cation diffusion facilitator family transporter [Candidatus Saccharimonadales bacterium]
MEPTESTTPSTRRVLVTSFFVDVLDVAMNATIAIITGSVVMLAETLEGFADMCSAGLLLIGFKKSARRANKLHPFGFGKELYFWSTLAAFVMVAITATLSFRIGYDKFNDPTAVKHIGIAIVVLAVAVVTNGYSFMLSARKLLEGKPVKKLWEAFLASPHIAPKSTLVLDAMGVMAAIFGLLSLTLYLVTGNSQFDGIGAMLVSLVLVASAVVLLITIRSLVIGQSAPREMERRIRDAVREIPEVRHIVGMRTMMLGSDSLLVNIDVHIRDGLSTDQIESVVEKVRDTAEQTGEGFTVHVEPDPEHHRTADHEPHHPAPEA